MPKIEMGKKYQTKDGKSVQILAVDLSGLAYDRSVVGVVEGYQYPYSWMADGHTTPHLVSNTDLIEVQPELEGWVNIYPWNGVLYPFKLGSNQAHAFETKDEADAEARPDRIACIKIKFKKGEGL